MVGARLDAGGSVNWRGTLGAITDRLGTQLVLTASSSAVLRWLLFAVLETYQLGSARRRLPPTTTTDLEASRAQQG